MTNYSGMHELQKLLPESFRNNDLVMTIEAILCLETSDENTIFDGQTRPKAAQDLGIA